jgi:two-component system response regulator FixJ
MASATPAPMIYVVDDDSDVLGSLRFLLETDGFEVRTFRNAAALLNGSVVDEVDCFVIDFKMPAMSGIELANWLRDCHVGTPVILISGYPDENIEKKATAAGIGHVLLKPYLEENLVSRIQDAIQEASAARR